MWRADCQHFVLNRATVIEPLLVEPCRIYFLAVSVQTEQHVWLNLQDEGFCSLSAQANENQPMQSVNYLRCHVAEIQNEAQSGSGGNSTQRWRFVTRCQRPRLPAILSTDSEPIIAQSGLCENRPVTSLSVGLAIWVRLKQVGPVIWVCLCWESELVSHGEE